jgi:hypothetical protein
MEDLRAEDALLIDLAGILKCDNDLHHLQANEKEAYDYMIGMIKGYRPKHRWTKFADSKPPNGAEIIVKYPSNVKAYGEWGKTFRDGIDPEAKWIWIYEAED